MSICTRRAFHGTIYIESVGSWEAVPGQRLNNRKQKVATLMTEPIEPDVRKQFSAHKPCAVELSSGPILGINFVALFEEAREMDLTEDQARDLLQAYINVAVHYTLMGFGLHPAQLVGKPDQTQEKSDLSHDFLASSPDHMVQLEYDTEGKISDELEPEGGAP